MQGELPELPFKLSVAHEQLGQGVGVIQLFLRHQLLGPGFDPLFDIPGFPSHAAQKVGHARPVARSHVRDAVDLGSAPNLRQVGVELVVIHLAAAGRHPIVEIAQTGLVKQILQADIVAGRAVVAFDRDEALAFALYYFVLCMVPPKNFQKI